MLDRFMSFSFDRGWTCETITAVVHADDIFVVGRKERCDRLCADLNRAIPVSRKELRSTEMVWRMSLLEGPREGYSNNIPTEFRKRIGE